MKPTTETTHATDRLIPAGTIDVQGVVIELYQQIHCDEDPEKIRERKNALLAQYSVDEFVGAANMIRAGHPDPAREAAPLHIAEAKRRLDGRAACVWLFDLAAEAERIALAQAQAAYIEALQKAQ